jgi:hypothetical protein
MPLDSPDNYHAKDVFSTLGSLSKRLRSLAKNGEGYALRPDASVVQKRGVVLVRLKSAPSERAFLMSPHRCLIGLLCRKHRDCTYGQTRRSK